MKHELHSIWLPAPNKCSRNVNLMLPICKSDNGRINQLGEFRLGIVRFTDRFIEEFIYC